MQSSATLKAAAAAALKREKKEKQLATQAEKAAKVTYRKRQKVVKETAAVIEGMADAAADCEPVEFAKSSPYRAEYRAVLPHECFLEDSESSDDLVSPKDMAALVKRFGSTARVAVPENDDWITVTPPTSTTPTLTPHPHTILLTLLTSTLFHRRERLSSSRERAGGRWTAAQICISNLAATVWSITGIPCNTMDMESIGS